MLSDDEQTSTTRIFACPQCPKIFATRSNLKRHMENPNIHNIPYVRSRDQKRWKGHSKKVVSKEETTESNNDRMRKWRAENREKNRQNDLRCRVYRLARQKYGDNDSNEKQGFVRQEIARRLGRRIMMERRDSSCSLSSSSNNCWNSSPPHHHSKMMSSPVHFTTPPSTPLLTASSAAAAADQHLLSPLSDLVELPFYSAPQQKIELPSINNFATRTNSWSSSSSSSSPQHQSFSSSSSASSSPILPHLSPNLHYTQQRRSISSSSVTSTNKIKKEKGRRSSVPSTSSIVMTAAKAAIITKTQKINSAFLSVNTTPIPTTNLLLLTPTTPDELLLRQETSQTVKEAAVAAVTTVEDDFCCVLPSMHNFLSSSSSSSCSYASAVPVPASSLSAVKNATECNYQQISSCSSNSIPTTNTTNTTTTTITKKGGIKFVDSSKILDEFVGVVLNYVDNNNHATTVAQ